MDTQAEALRRVQLNVAIRPPVDAFAERFLTVPSDVRGRGGDLDPAVWAVAKFSPDGVDAYPAATHNHIQLATIPACRATFSDTTVYPPYDLLICDPSGAKTARLMLAIRQQFYGQQNIRILQPFDFANRTGVIRFHVDAITTGATGCWFNLDLTQDPLPAHTFLEAGNHETGPIPNNAVLIAFGGGGTAGRVTVGNVNVYTGYSMTTLTPGFSVSGTNMPTVNAGDLNRIEIRISTSLLQVWMSDASTDDELTFPNFRRIYEAALALTWTRGYVHLAGRNHATEKFALPPEQIYYVDDISFDGPVLSTPRHYEVPDNSVIGTVPPNLPDEPGFDYMRLGYEVSDGTNKAEGVWDGNGNFVSPLTFTGSVNLSGAASAQLTLNLFANAAGSATTAWGLKYRFNGGTWRTRLLTAGDVTAINTSGSAGNLALVVDVLLGDLVSGSNTIDFSGVNLPMGGYNPLVMNIDLLVHA